MSIILSKLNNLLNKINTICESREFSCVKEVAKLNEKVESAMDIATSISNIADSWKLASALKCLAKDQNVEKSINDLYDYVTNPDRAFYVSTCFRKIILSNSMIAASIIGVMLGEIENRKREFDRTDIILLNILENISDYDIRIFYELMSNKYISNDIGREYIDEVKFPNEKKNDFFEILELGEKYRIFGIFTYHSDEENFFLGEQYYKKPAADKLMDYIEQVKQILNYNI